MKEKLRQAVHFAGTLSNSDPATSDEPYALVAIAIVSFLGFWGVITTAAWMALRRRLGKLYAPIGGAEDGARPPPEPSCDLYAPASASTSLETATATSEPPGSEQTAEEPSAQRTAPMTPSDPADEILGDEEEAGGQAEGGEKEPRRDLLLDAVD